MMTDDDPRTSSAYTDDNDSYLMFLPLSFSEREESSMLSQGF